MRIRGAITSKALVFLACFSKSSLARSRSYQNEELVVAIEQLRQRSPELPWLIPIRFDDCEIPDRDIGGGRTFTSIQRVDLLGDHYDDGARRLVAAILRILGRDSDSARTETGPAPQEEAHPPTVSSIHVTPPGQPSRAAKGADIEGAIRAADPEDIGFSEFEVLLSTSFEEFCSWLTEKQPSITIESIREDYGRSSDFYHSGKFGHLTYYLDIRLRKEGITFSRRVDVVREWLHPAVLRLAGSDVGVAWDTSLFPVEDQNGEALRVDHPLADCRDCVYWVLFAKP
jgi:hypothetical protein